MFSSADLIFQKYVSVILNINNEMELFLRIILILITIFIFTGAYAYSLREENKPRVCAIFSVKVE